MTDYLNCTNQQPPTYSGVTINITNPAMNIPPQYPPMPPEIFYNNYNPYQMQNPYYNAQLAQPGSTQYINKGEYLEPVSDLNADYSKLQNASDIKSESKEINQSKEIGQSKEMSSYPQQYYINNYAQNPEQPSSEQALTIKVEQDKISDKNTDATDENKAANIYPDTNTQDNTQAILPAAVTEGENNNKPLNVSDSSTDTEEALDLETSKEIIQELDERNAEEKKLEKSGKKTTIVSLTNEYIMSLENYLNNPNTDIRLMAAKEILTRLDEDRNRYDDAALNALLNKMLQDPNKLIRIAALSAFSSELASGNDFTVQLLTQIQQNPDADPEDVLEASQILLKRAAVTEIRYVPVPNQENNGET